MNFSLLDSKCNFLKCTTHHSIGLPLILYATLVLMNINLAFSDQISSPSKSCYSHIRELRCIRPYLDLILKQPVTRR